MTINELLLEGRETLSCRAGALGVGGCGVGGHGLDGRVRGLEGRGLEGRVRGLEGRVSEAVSALESEVLLAHVLGCSREDLLRDGDSSEEVPSSEKELFMRYVREVAEGKPVAYITNSKEFYGMDFYVDERVLIPRPETEMIVDEVLQWLSSRVDAERDREVKLLDVGTGSLCITAAIARHYGHVFAHAVDVSEEALEVARVNREMHGLETHVEIYQSDLLSAVEDVDFDVIVANLPYIGEGKAKIVDVGVEGSEPATALFGGGDGLELYKKLIQQIQDKKVDFDLMVCEFGYGQERAVRAMLDKFFDQKGGCKGGCGWEVKSDLAGIPRIFVVKKI